MPGHDPNWKHKFNQRQAMKQMGIDPDKNKIIMNNERPEPTDEEKAKIKKKQKEAQEKQAIARIQSLEKSIPLKQAKNNLQEKTIIRMKAEQNVLRNVVLEEETNEWKRKSIHADIESMDLEIEQMEQVFMQESADLNQLKDELAKLKSKGENE